MRLWDSATTRVNDAILAFTVGDDPQRDLALLPYDCLASAAHADMLHGIGLLSDDERARLFDALREAYQLARDGKLTIEQEQEDGHTALEAFLTQAAGEAGRKIHTGRSRNDQVIAALRLYARDALLDIADASVALATVLIDRGQEHASALMPGYTHTRQAMPSTVGQLLFATGEGLVRDLDALLLALGHANRSALGSASGYGVPLPLDRQRVSDSLGHQELDLNSVFVQNSRGRFEGIVLFALHQLSMTLSRLASDLILFSSEQFGFFELPLDLTTGSSIMPQKRNPDVLELVRAIPASLLGRYTEVTGLLQGLGAGYHRDLQRTKAPLMDGLEDTRNVLAVMQLAIERLGVNAQACEAALGEGIYQTDAVYAHVREGAAFRGAYRRVKESPQAHIDHAELLRTREHEGVPGSDQSEALRLRLQHAQEALAPHRARGALLDLA